MRNVFRKGRFIWIPIAAAAFLLAVSFVVMVLWNDLIPRIFHVGTITLLQATELFVLCKILFGLGKGGRFFGNSPWMRHRMADRFKQMTPEEREAFKAKMNSRMDGRFGRGRNRCNRQPGAETEVGAEPQA